MEAASASQSTMPTQSSSSSTSVKGRPVDGAEMVDLAAEERHHNVLDQSLGRDVVGPVVVRRAEGADVGNSGDGERENEAHRRLLAPRRRRRTPRARSYRPARPTAACRPPSQGVRWHFVPRHCRGAWVDDPPVVPHTQMSAPSAVGDRTHGALTSRHSTAIPFYPLRGVFTHARPHVTMRAPLALPAPPSAPRRCSPHAWPPRIIRTHPVRWCSTECTTRADARAHRQGEIKMRRWSCPAA